VFLGEQADLARAGGQPRGAVDQAADFEGEQLCATVFGVAVIRTSQETVSPTAGGLP
jgi:hypothetical protein